MPAAASTKKNPPKQRPQTETVTEPNKNRSCQDFQRRQDEAYMYCTSNARAARSWDGDPRDNLALDMSRSEKA